MKNYKFKDKYKRTHTFTKKDITIGISSDNCKGKHNFLADVDLTPLETVIKNLEPLAKSSLPTIYIIQSSNAKKLPGSNSIVPGASYHAISFPKNGLSLNTYIAFLKKIKADKNFIMFTEKDRKGTLRIKPKKGKGSLKLAAVIPSKNNIPEDKDAIIEYFKILSFSGDTND